MTASPFAEIITITHHLAASAISTYLTTTALEDIRNAATPAPRAVDQAGRQRNGSSSMSRYAAATRSGASSRGRDIYAVTAPLVVQAARRLIDGRAKVHGAAAPAEAFDAADFLGTLSPDHLTIRPKDPS